MASVLFSPSFGELWMPPYMASPAVSRACIALFQFVEFCGCFPLRKQIQKYNGNIMKTNPELSTLRSMAQIKTYPFAVLFAKEPLYFWQINPQFKAYSQITFSSLESIVSSFQIQNTFSLIYRFATDFVLAITFPF